MSKLSFSVYLNAYSDSHSSNAPSLNNFKWNREISCMPVSDPVAHAFTLAPGETRSLFSGVRTLAQDGSTQYQIALKPLSTNTYVLSNVGGTAPNFRTPRSTGADATTAVTVTQNGPLLTFASTAGTNFNLAGAQVGDTAFIAGPFNPLNQGAFKILALNATSFTVENELGTPEGPFVLGSSFASYIQIYSAAGVQIGDTLQITGGFSVVSQQSFQVTAVYANSVEFYANSVLPQEGPITTQAIAIYSQAKQLVYLEADQNVAITINGSAAGVVQPFVLNQNSPAAVQPGVFMLKSTMYSMSVTNNSTNPANCFIASAE